MAITQTAKKTQVVSPANPLTMSFNCNGGDLLVLGLCVAGGLRAVSAPTYNGIAMTASPEGVVVGAVANVEMWYLVNPAAGDNTISIPNPSTRWMVPIASAWDGVDTTSPLDTSNSDSNAWSANPAVLVATTSPNELVIDVLIAENNDLPTGNSHIIISSQDTNGWTSNAQYTTGQDPAGNVTLSWTVPANEWAMIVCAFKVAMNGGIIKMTSPDGATNRTVQPTTVRYEGTMGEASTLEMLFEVDFDIFEDEAEATNVCQVNSLVEWARGSQTRTFYVMSRNIVESEGGTRHIEALCVDPIGKLQATVASISGNPLLTESSPPLDIDEETLTEIDADMGDVKWRFYPVRGSDAWLPHNLSNSSTLSGNIAIDATTILLSTDHAGIAPIGYVQIQDEWIQYDGYDFGETDEYYRLKSCTRGALGSTSATHTGATVVYQRLSQRVHPAKVVLVEGYNVDDSAWEYLDADTFAVQVTEGAIDFNYDVSAYGDPKWSKFQASYAVFDEDHADTVILSDIFSGVLNETVANGGPAFTAIDLDGLDSLRLTRVRVEHPTNTLDFMLNLLDEIGLSKGADEDFIGLWFNHSDYKVTCKPIEQTGTADYYFNHMTHMEREISLEDIYSAVMVEYEAGYNDNLVTYNRMWHPQVDDTEGSNSEAITHIVYSDDLYEDFDPTWERYASAGHNVYTNRLCDGQADTGWGIRFSKNPGTGVNALWCYFSNPATAYTVDSIKVVCDFRKNSGDTNPIHFKVMGVEDFDIVAPTDSTGIVDISGNLVKMFEKNKGTAGFPTVELEASNIGMDLEGIVLRWEGANEGGAADGDRYCLVREIKVYGHKTRTVLVSLTDNPALGSKYMYAPDSYAKLYDDKLGQPRVKHLKIGASTYNAAISLGRLQLLQTLLYDTTRLYVNNTTFDDIPELGKTIRTGDGFTGVLLSEEYAYGADESETLTIRLMDFGAGLIQ